MAWRWFGALVVLAGLGAFVPAADVTACSDVIAVSRNGDFDGDAEVHAIAADGTSRLVTGDWVATKPSLAPDGAEVVVVRAEGNYESAGPDSTSLWRISTDGGGPRRVTEDGAAEEPAWSPDGERIAYFDRAASAIVTVDVDGGQPHIVVRDRDAGLLAPAWSPDSTRLAFVRRDFNSEGRTSSISTVNADGSDLRRISDLAAYANSISWHPDGTAVLVSSIIDSPSVDVIDLRSGDVRRVAEDATLAVWAGHGDRVYFFAASPRRSDFSLWRLAEGRLVDGRLVRERYVNDDDEFLYPYFGIDVATCAT